jgi:hypothetical protein
LDEIQAGLNEHDIARSIFASYCGVPATRLGLCLDGAKAWSPADLAVCQKSLREMLDLAKSVSPLPIDWRKVGLVRNVLEARRASKTFVVTSDQGCFSHLDASYRPIFNETGVALTGEAAHRICGELRKLNFANVKAMDRQLLAGEKSKDFFTAWKAQLTQVRQSNQ